MDPQKGSIVFLRGMSSAGKTSICQALSALDNSWKAISEDDYCMDVKINEVERQFPMEFSNISKAIAQVNLFNAIVRHEILFLPSASPEEQEKAKIAIDFIRTFLDDPKNHIKGKDSALINKKLMDDIQQHAQNGSNVIVDSWFLRQEDFEKCRQQFKVYTVFTHAPLPILLERQKQRNKAAVESGNLRNTKFFDQTLNVFKKIKLAKDTTHAIDVLTKDTLIVCFASIRSQLTFQSADRPLFSRREITIEELDTLKKELLDKFGDSKELYITPIEFHDLVLNTTEHKPKFYAQLIKKKVEPK